MKKLFTLFIAPMLVVLSAKAQKADIASAIVHYKFSHLRDTTKPDAPYTENMILLIGKNATAYKSYDRKLADALVKKQLQEQLANSTPGGPVQLKLNRNSAGGTSTEYYMFAAENKLVRKERLINSYLIEEPLPVINWKISSDTASFAGLHCQKATAHFKGRDYTAWFCPDIPVHGGPWKLSGLPGLILEAYDTQKQVMFKFDGLEDMSKAEQSQAVAQAEPDTHVNNAVKIFGIDDTNADPRAIELPADGIKTNEKDFTKLKDAMRKDPQAFAQSAIANLKSASGANVNINTSQPQVNFKVNANPVVENNPIELPGKQ